MGKQTSDSAQTGPGVKAAVTSAGSLKTAQVPVKGVAMPEPKLKQAKGGWNGMKP